MSNELSRKIPDFIYTINTDNDKTWTTVANNCQVSKKILSKIGHGVIKMLEHVLIN